ncbi:hypothetical protein LUZ63_024299 [Rhynchospora breviuscula]|uniref:pyruvate, water dikinase n=1 Tax=Rhynchospora breviuscula TaxID=2022672 RepID=A0A9Q0BW74_9POAL|nr:hypothetical protein LUZ63_024299 [Rhynchospora breviuscula]
MAPPFDTSVAHAPGARAVFFVSDSTGITAETLGSALLANFPRRALHAPHDPLRLVRDGRRWGRGRPAAGSHGRTRPPSSSRRSRMPASARGWPRRAPWSSTSWPATSPNSKPNSARPPSRARGSTTARRPRAATSARMRAVEFAIEHDDGQSERDLASADVIIVAPSRCGKTPTTMYLALHYGLLVANYPLTDDDFPTDGLPRIVAPHSDRCFGLTTTALRLSQVRHERRPHSTYASLAQCTLEIRRAEDLYRRTHIPFLSSATRKRRGDVRRDPAVHEPAGPTPRKAHPMTNILRFDEIGMSDLARVGGKNASLGEMVSHLASAGIRVPPGFATTSDAFGRFLAEGSLDARIREAVAGIDVDDVAALSQLGGPRACVDRGAAVPGRPRSRHPATAEDLPDASFAGQQETFLNIGGIDNILQAIRRVFASLYNDRAIAYRAHHGFDHHEVALSAGVQRMVRSDIGASGVMFTLDTESGLRRRRVPHQLVRPRRSRRPGSREPPTSSTPTSPPSAPVAPRSSSVRSARRPSRCATPTDVTSTAARPSSKWMRRTAAASRSPTRRSRNSAASRSSSRSTTAARWTSSGARTASTGSSTCCRAPPRDGRVAAVGERAQPLRARRAQRRPRRGPCDRAAHRCGSRARADLDRADGRLRPRRRARGRYDRPRLGADHEARLGDRDRPRWAHVSRRDHRARARHPRRRRHGRGTHALKDGQEVTVSCAEGDDGVVYDGILDFAEEVTELDRMPEAPVKMMMNVGTPDQAFAFSRLPNAGVGLARLEFIINRQIGIHPRALLELDRLDGALADDIRGRIAAYPSPEEYFIQRVAEGVSMIAAAFAPEPVIVRLSDFKSNEYANLIGGTLYEPDEENPMLGYRGAARYVSPEFRACFDMECEALRRVRDEMGLTNVQIMVPFVRTVGEARAVVELLAQNGLRRGENGLKVVMMCELPANAILAERFLEHFDGFSIGSNDMTQLTLGLDRDSALMASAFDERDPAVLHLLGMAIDACRRQGKYVGICGQGPSDHPDFAQWLVARGIQSLSLNPDTVVETWLALAANEVPKAEILTRAHLSGL